MVCPHHNQCLSCGSFVTTIDFYDVHTQQLKSLKALLPEYEKKGMLSKVATTKKDIAKLEEIIEKIEETLKTEGFHLVLRNDDFSSNQLDCFWNGDLSHFADIEDDNYRIEVRVCGDTRYTYKNGDDEFTSEDPTELWDYGIDTDEKLYEMLDNESDDCCIEMIDNNWIEMPIYDKRTNQYITDVFDGCAIIPDTNNILEAIDGGMREYIEGFLEEEMEI
jgi:hypothetical protein